MGFPVHEQLQEAGLGDWLTDAGVLARYHARGGNELVHRAVKDFGTLWQRANLAPVVLLQ